MKNLILATALLSGCANVALTANERERQQCLSYGLAEGTQEHANCRIQLSTARMERSNALGALGAAMLLTPPPQPASPHASFNTYLINGRLYHCNTLGSITNCN